MCGIAGSIGRLQPDQTNVDRALTNMYNRGPDAHGYWMGQSQTGSVCLLHSRLAIIDINDSAIQPMKKNDCVLVFNGEIYNYLEIRKQLVKIGFGFRTNSDSEVLITAYLAWGVDCLDKLEGMWSFALFDGRTKQLFLSRDRFGEKPLLYTKLNGTFYFASEAKALRSLTGKPLTPNLNKISRYLVNGFRSLYKNTESFYEDVFEFPSGHYAVVTDP